MPRARRIGAPKEVSWATSAAIHHDLGELEHARSHYEQALAIASEVGDRRWEGNGRCNLGLLYQEQGRTAEARAQFDMALNIAREVGHIRLEYIVLCNLGILLTGGRSAGRSGAAPGAGGQGRDCLL